MPHTTQKSAKPPRTLPADITRPLGVLILCTILPIMYGLAPLIKVVGFALFVEEVVLFSGIYLSIVQIGNIAIAIGFIFACFFVLRGVRRARKILLYLVVIRFGIFGVLLNLYLLLAAHPPPKIAKELVDEFILYFVLLVVNLWYFSRRKVKAFYGVV